MTTNKQGLDWIQHFDQYTRSCTKSLYCFLILDSYKSYYLTDFKLFCKKNNIITLCILVYLSYKLQLLDIDCFCILKKLYSSEIKKLIYIYIIYISKEDFFPAFQTVFCIAITESNIKKGFRESGLVLFDPEYIIS